MRLLTTSNAKTRKGEKKGWLTGILHLASATNAGRKYNVCPFADRGCRRACLYTAGRGQFDSVKESRIRKTRWLFDDRGGFIDQLCDDIAALVRKAYRQGMGPAVRLNGTSDIPWYSPEFGNIMARFPSVQFYDYTRSSRRVRTVKRPNYYLLLSRGICNEAACKRTLAAGHNVAVIFEKIPQTHWGYPVLTGDDSDLRFLDPSPAVVGLSAKGDARRDTTGFVVR